MSFKAAYRQLAIDNFNTQMIADIENTDRVIEVCQEDLERLGYPANETNEDDWIEYVYMAQEMWEIARNGHVYRRKPNPDKLDGWEFVLYTRANHPAFMEDQS